MKQPIILKSKVAKGIIEHLLKTFKGENRNSEFPYAGFYKENDKFICFDNRSGSCYVEETTNKKKAVKWCKGEIEASAL